MDETDMTLSELNRSMCSLYFHTFLKVIFQTSPVEYNKLSEGLQNSYGYQNCNFYFKLS